MGPGGLLSLTGQKTFGTWILYSIQAMKPEILMEVSDNTLPRYQNQAISTVSPVFPETG